MAEAKRSEINQYLTFKLLDEVYAVKVTYIREVLSLTRITKVPRMPDFMMGIINLRGKVVPVLDLTKKFGLGDTETTENTAIIVTMIAKTGIDGKSEELTIGMLSNSVQKVITIEPNDIQGPPKIGIAIDTAFITGMTQIDNRFVIILDINKILTGTELSELEADRDLGAAVMKGVQNGSDQH